MKAHHVTTKSGRRIWLFTDDTFTLAIGTERTESTPKSLAEILSKRTLQSLKAHSHDSAERAKLEKSILMSMYL